MKEYEWVARPTKGDGKLGDHSLSFFILRVIKPIPNDVIKSENKLNSRRNFLCFHLDSRLESINNGKIFPYLGNDPENRLNRGRKFPY